jgi:hypothetical protein
MRCLFAALAAIMFLTMPAYSQGMGGGGPRKHQPQDNVQPEEKKNKVDDKAYKSALDRIPASDQKADPWQGVREAPKGR